MDLIFGQEYAK